MGDPAPFNLERARTTCLGFLRSVFPHEFSGAPRRPEPTPASGPDDKGEPIPAFDTLPTWVYHDPEFFELEKENIFQKNWILLGHASLATTEKYTRVAGDRLREAHRRFHPRAWHWPSNSAPSVRAWRNRLKDCVRNSAVSRLFSENP